jgi:hypothetical protein
MISCEDLGLIRTGEGLRSKPCRTSEDPDNRTPRYQRTSIVLAIKLPAMTSYATNLLSHESRSGQTSVIRGRKAEVDPGVCPAGANIHYTYITLTPCSRTVTRARRSHSRYRVPRWVLPHISPGIGFPICPKPVHSRDSSNEYPRSPDAGDPGDLRCAEKLPGFELGKHRDWPRRSNVQSCASKLSLCIAVWYPG